MCGYAAIIGAAQAQRSAAIIGAATTADQQGRQCERQGSGSGAAQLLLVRLRRCAAIIGAAQAQRSYYWCGSGAATQQLLVRLRRCYAAIIGAATQLLSALLRSYYRRCYAAIIGAATQLLSALLRSYYRRCYHGGSAGVAVKRGRVRLRRPCHEEHEEKYTEICKRNEDVTDSLHAMSECLVEQDESTASKVALEFSPLFPQGLSLFDATLN
jgi:hypothetical protein